MGVFEYACHEGNYGMRMLAASRLQDRPAASDAPARKP